MKKFNSIKLWIFVAVSVFSITNANAAIRLSTGEDLSIHIGLRLMSYFAVKTKYDLDKDIAYNLSLERLNPFFNLRSANLRIGAEYYKAQLFFQTDINGQFVNILDVFLTYKFFQFLQIYTGIHLPPSHRDGLTKSLTTITIESPVTSRKTMTSLGKGVAAHFDVKGGTSYSLATNFALASPPNERDTGLTFFGSHSFSPIFHAKYYSGFYSGTRTKNNNQIRYTQRLQVNFFEAENTYFSYGTYLGEITTLALGASIDYQKDVVSTKNQPTDYFHYTIDLFTEVPLLDKSLIVSFESAFSSLDLKDIVLDTEGYGVYFQTGWLIGGFSQIWLAYEFWKSKHPQNVGTFQVGRLGNTFFFSKHDIKLSVGYEIFRSENFNNPDYYHTFITEIKINI